MLDDRHLRRRRVPLIRPPALRPRARILRRIEIAAQRGHDRGMADADAGLVHHVEHVFDAAVRLADEVAEAVAALAEIEQAVGRAALAHLVVEAGERDVVRRAESSVPADPALGHEEQRDALGAGRPAGDLGQHHVDDVLRDLLLAAGDPHLAAADAVEPVLRRGRGGADVGERGAGLRLGQAHRAEPAAFEHGRQERFPERVRAEGVEQVGRRHRQEGIVADRRVGAGEEAADGGVQEPRRLQPAGFLGEGEGEEAGLREGAQRLAGRRRHAHLAVDEGRLVGVDLGRAGEELRLGDLLGGVEHLPDRAAVVGGETRTLQEPLDAEQLEQDEIQVPAVDDHWPVPSAWSGPSIGGRGIRVERRAGRLYRLELDSRPSRAPIRHIE